MTKVDQNHYMTYEFNNNKGCVTPYSLAIYIKKYFKAKEEELWKLIYNFTTQKIIFFKKNPLKETKIPQGFIINSITNLKFQHKPHLSKILT
jgi:hypothetical protein